MPAEAVDAPAPLDRSSTALGVSCQRTRRPSALLATSPRRRVRASAWRAFFSSTPSDAEHGSTSDCVHVPPEEGRTRREASARGSCARAHGDGEARHQPWLGCTTARRYSTTSSTVVVTTRRIVRARWAHDASQPIDFETDPSLDIATGASTSTAPVATLTLAVDPTGGLRDDYELKLNSYDLGVDIELHDALQRLRFEHPRCKAVVVTGGLDKVFCAGANIQMLAGVVARATRSTSASSPTRRATRIEEPSAHRVRCGSPPSTALLQAAATSLPWRATRSCSSTIARRRCRCPRCRCSPCSRERAG